MEVNQVSEERRLKLRLCEELRIEQERLEISIDRINLQVETMREEYNELTSRETELIDDIYKLRQNRIELYTKRRHWERLLRGVTTKYESLESVTKHLIEERHETQKRLEQLIEDARVNAVLYNQRQENMKLEAQKKKELRQLLQPGPLALVEDTDKPTKNVPSTTETSQRTSAKLTKKDPSFVEAEIEALAKQAVDALAVANQRLNEDTGMTAEEEDRKYNELLKNREHLLGVIIQEVDAVNLIKEHLNKIETGIQMYEKHEKKQDEQLLKKADFLQGFNEDIKSRIVDIQRETRDVCEKINAEVTKLTTAIQEQQPDFVLSLRYSYNDYSQIENLIDAYKQYAYI